MRAGKLSVILLSYQSEARLEKATGEIREVLSREGIPHEIVIIDDGSTDRSVKKAEELSRENQTIRVFPLSRNYTSPMAQFAGLEVCSGDCAAPMPDDGQRPLPHLVDMYRRWQEGHDVVVGYRTGRRDGWFSDFWSGRYYAWMNTFSDVRFPPGGSDGYLIDRSVIDILNTQVSKRNTTPVMEILRLGFPTVFLPYERPPRAGKSRWTFQRKINLALNTFFASSIAPLRLITWLGLGVFCLSLAAILMIIAAKLFSDNRLFGLPVQGWATLVVLITLFNGLIMLCIGIVSEYLWRMYDEVKHRPPYLFRDKGRS